MNKYHKEDHGVGREGRVSREEGETDFLKLMCAAVGIGAQKVRVVDMLVLVLGAVDVRDADVEKVRSQPADCVFGDVGGELGTRGSK
jgi:hypothetical protein